MAGQPTRAGRRKYLVLSLLANLGTLFAFKYASFFNESVRDLLSQWGAVSCIPHFDLLLPVGISFYTFQSMSYTIDVYRGQKSAERHFGLFALYVAFFPQLVAGPIERSVHLFPQLTEAHVFRYEQAVSGLRLVLWGLFKKAVVADRLAVYVQSVYDNVPLHSTSSYVVATYFFALQIYCDFSGYSDIAIGVARMLGFNLMTNFRTPYLSQSIQEFWSRWHISLSTWFRDYVYIPLGGNRVPKARRCLNLMTVFVVSGLWHGANWTFVVWGALHGAAMVLSLLSAGARAWLARFFHLWGVRHLLPLLRILVTFHLVCLGWIYFRAESLTDANHMVASVLSGNSGPLFIGSLQQFVLGLWGIAVLLVFDAFQGKGTPDVVFERLPTVARWASYLFLTANLLLFGVFDGGQFIYFQF